MTRSIVSQAHDFYDAVPYEVPVPDTSLYELLDTAARLYPDRVALDYFGATTTYAHVRDQVLRAARVLHEAGVRAGDTVAISLPNCPQAFVAFYACMRIGAVAAQHNPLAPVAEIAGQLERHGGRVAIVWEKCAEAFPLDRLNTVFTVDISHGMPASQRFLLSLPVPRARQMRAQLRGPAPKGAISWDRATASSSPIDADHPLPSPGDRAVILHTSGTNGVPKSAPLTHRNIGVNVNQCMFWVWKLHEGAETFFSLLPYFHAFGLTFFLCASVRKAATQVLLPKFDAQMALEAHKRRPVTFFVGVPPMFERILARAKETGTDLSSIRYSVAGAMPLSTALADDWEATTGGLIIEGYGLSETAPVLTGAPLSAKRRHGVLGVPFPSTQLRLVSLEDDTLDVEDGQPGEIIVRGPQVFDGYLKRTRGNRARLHVGRLVQDRRHRRQRRRLHLHGRPQEGTDPVGRLQRLSLPGRSGNPLTTGRRGRRRRRCARRGRHRRGHRRYHHGGRCPAPHAGAGAEVGRKVHCSLRTPPPDRVHRGAAAQPDGQDPSP